MTNYELWNILEKIATISLIISTIYLTILLFALPFIVMLYNPKKYYKIKSHNINLNFTTIIKAKNKKQAQIKYYSNSLNKFDIIDSIEELEDE